MYIEKKIKQLEDLKKQIPNQVKIIANNNKKQLLDYIRIKQLFEKGIDGLGNVLGVYKNTYDGDGRGYPKIKGTRFNFFDTGSLTNKMDLFVTDQYTLAVFSTDAKYPELIEEYPNMFLYTIENIKEIESEIFLKQLYEWMIKTPAFTQI